MLKQLHEKLASLKGMDNPAPLSMWKWPELFSFVWGVTFRVVRGVGVKLRLRKSSGLILCEKGVRLHHARYISAGRALNLEEGCEIVGLSKKGIVFGNKCAIKRNAVIRPTNLLLDEPGEGMRMGDGSNIGAFSYIGCSGYIEIGNNVLMGPRVNLLAENHHAERTDIPMKNQGVVRSTIRIEDDCWLGCNSTILAGVTVGRGAIVAAGAVVTKDVPPFSVVGGVPARILKRRDGVCDEEA